MRGIVHARMRGDRKQCGTDRNGRNAGVPAGWPGCVSLPVGRSSQMSLVTKRRFGLPGECRGPCRAGSETQPVQPARTPAFRKCGFAAMVSVLMNLLDQTA